MISVLERRILTLAELPLLSVSVVSSVFSCWLLVIKLQEEPDVATVKHNKSLRESGWCVYIFNTLLQTICVSNARPYCDEIVQSVI